MLSKEERKRLAVRVRLGEVGSRQNPQDWFEMHHVSPPGILVLVLGVEIGSYTFDQLGARVWRCGFRHPRTCEMRPEAEFLAYLERD